MVKAAFGPWIREPINIASGKGVTVLELAGRIVQLTGSSSPVHNAGRRQQEVGRFVADITYARKVLGMSSPEDPLEHLPEVLSCVAGQ